MLTTLLWLYLDINVNWLMQKLWLAFVTSWMIHTFSVVLSYDILEDRYMDDVTVNNNLLFYLIKQVNSMLQRVCIDHRRYQNVVLILWLPDQIYHSPYCQQYNLYNVSSENLVLDQLIIPKLIFFFILITYLVDIVLIL